MNSTSQAEEPVIEPKPNGEEGMEVTEQALRLRIRQQEILTELGVLALKGTPFADLLAETARLAAEGLQLAVHAGHGRPRRIGVGRTSGSAVCMCRLRHQQQHRCQSKQLSHRRYQSPSRMHFPANISSLFLSGITIRAGAVSELSAANQRSWGRVA